MYIYNIYATVFAGADTTVPFMTKCPVWKRIISWWEISLLLNILTTVKKNNSEKNIIMQDDIFTLVVL